MATPRTSVLIVGAGPVGVTLALDLASRGVDCVIVEQRSQDEIPKPRANHVSSRAMETYRRLGIADEIRRSGLPPDFPTDVVWVTSMTGYEITRIPLPSPENAGTPGFVDSDWATPEPQHKINQMYLEPILRRHAMANARIRLLFRTRFDGFRDTPAGVAGRITNLDNGEASEVECEYLVGCDGGSSGIRKAIGARFEGDPAITRVVSLHLVAPDLIRCLPHAQAHRYFVINQEQSGVAVCLDGRETWSFHVMLPTADSDPGELGRDRAIRTMIGPGADVSYRIFSEDAWTGRRLLASRFRNDRVFICGDAAHIWVPNAGYGMNAGIADAENLAWRLAAVLQGWGGGRLLDGYERERWPITDQVSHTAKELAIRNRAREFRVPPPELAEDSAPGRSARARYGEMLREINLPQFAPAGLNFAYFYDDSPNIVYDDEPAPQYSLGEYAPTTVPGCRVPHFCVPDGTSIYDLLGPDYTLLRFDPTVDVSAIVGTAGDSGVPLAVLDVEGAADRELYRHALLLARPDRHVAWRGNAQPDDPTDVVTRISGRVSN